MAQERFPVFSTQDIYDAADILEQLFYIRVDAGRTEPFFLQDNDLSEVTGIVADTDQFDDIEAVMGVVAFYNAAVFELETRLREDGFAPSPHQGVICEFSYDTVSGYNYREDRSWVSFIPRVSFEIRSRN